MRKSELEKAAKDYCFDNKFIMYDAVVGSIGPLLTGTTYPNPDNIKSFEAGAKWALEWVADNTRKLKQLDEFELSLEIEDETETKEK